MKLVALLAMVLAAFSVLAGEPLYRCVDAKGITSYQNDPCAPGTRFKGVHVYKPEARPTRVQLEQAERRRRQGEAESAELRRLAGTDWIHRPSAPSATGPRSLSPREQQWRECKAMKEARDRALAVAPIGSRHGVRAHHDKKVFSACKGL